jgi:hypothetical protein
VCRRGVESPVAACGRADAGERLGRTRKSYAAEPKCPPRPNLRSELHVRSRRRSSMPTMSLWNSPSDEVGSGHQLTNTLADFASPLSIGSATSAGKSLGSSAET